MKPLRLFLIMPICILSGVSLCRASVQLTEAATYYLPGFSQPLKQITFADLDGFGQPEILASDGERIALYSPDNAMTLFETGVDQRAICHRICLADADRDLITDILIGFYYDVGVFASDTVCLLKFFSGASGFTNCDSLFFTSDASEFQPRSSPWSFVDLRTLDLDNDGAEELLFSYDRYRTTSLGPTILQHTTGETLALSNFPNAELWQRNALTAGTRAAQLDVTPALLATNVYSSVSALPSTVTATGWVEIISAGGDSLLSVGEPTESVCVGDSSFLFSVLECLAVGDIEQYHNGIEMLIRQHWSQTCYQAGSVSFDSSGTTLRLYSVEPGDGINLLWSDSSPEITSNFHYLPEFPGSFFSAAAGLIRQHSGLNGETCQVSMLLDADTLIWLENSTMGDLIAVKNQTVQVYELGLTTGAEDETLEASIPGSFSLGDPFPNPFNPSCVIEYSLPKRTHATVAIFNILGQQVATIVDGVIPAGNHKIEWNGTDQSGQPVASGIYLYRMQAGDFADSKKMLLLK